MGIRAEYWYMKFIGIKRSGLRHLPLAGLVLFLCLPLSGVSPARSDSHHAFFGVALDGHPLTESRLEVVEDEIGLKPDLVVFFLQWPGPGNTDEGIFPVESLDAVWSRGAVPCVTWEPMYIEDGAERTIHWSLILDGFYDGYLISFAEQAGLWGRPFIIRFAHEMNLERYHWGTTKEDYGPESPMIYQRMFRYVVDTFKKAGADNVLWAFCPNAESVPSPMYQPEARWNTVRNYYPGDEYVDILGMDGYNWGTTQTVEQDGWDSHWKGFREIFGHLYCELRKINPKKPIFIFETSTAHHGGDRSAWVKEAALTIGSWSVKGIVWFHVDKEQDWRLTSEEAGMLSAGGISGGYGPDLREWIQGKTKWTENH